MVKTPCREHAENAAREAIPDDAKTDENHHHLDEVVAKGRNNRKKHYSNHLDHSQPDLWLFELSLPFRDTPLRTIVVLESVVTACRKEENS